MVHLPSVDPERVLVNLYAQGVRSLLVEGGPGVAAAFLEAGRFDRVGVDLAPLLIGGVEAPGPLAGAGFATLAEAARLSDLRLERRGGDVILTGFHATCLQDLCESVGA